MKLVHLPATLLIFVCGLFQYSFAATVDTLEVFSDSMNKIVKNTVVVPEGYSNSEKDFPVLYMLHGASGNYRSWPGNFPVMHELANRYGIIIVCPDGGYTSWYFDSPMDSSYRYETYMTGELVPAIDKKYRTIDEAKGRGIMGLSMGGHGAFFLSFRHPEIWGAAGSTSGGMDLRPFPNSWDIAKRLGSQRDFPEHWENFSIINMIHLLNGKQPQLFFDCGVDDFFYDGNRKFHALLVERNIPHNYLESPGGHTREYWQKSIHYQFVFFNEFFYPEKQTVGD